MADPEKENEAFSHDLHGDAIEWGPCPEFMPEDCRLAVLQGDPAKRNADVLFRLAGNTTAERHWHTSTERMVLLSGELHVVYDDQEPVIMKPGTYAYGPACLMPPSAAPTTIAYCSSRSTRPSMRQRAHRTDNITSAAWARARLRRDIEAHG